MKKVSKRFIPIAVVLFIASAVFYYSYLASTYEKTAQNNLNQVYNVTQKDIYLGSKNPLTAQRAEGFKPRADLPTWPLTDQIDWSADPYNDNNWRFQLNAWRMIDPYFQDYFKTDNPERLLEAFTFVRDWYDFHIINRNKNDYAWYDMSMGIRGLYIAYFISADGQGIISLSEADKEILDTLAKEHVKITHKIGISSGNHGFFQVSGLALICKVKFEAKFCKNELKFARHQAKALMEKQFTPEGIHKENSPSYHFFAYKIVNRLGAFRHVLDEAELKKIASHRPWLVFPNNDIAAIGDSAGKSKPLLEDTHKTCFDSGRCFALAPFEPSGYAIVRDLPSESPDSMLFVTGMAYNTIHAHSDALSFELFEFGRMIFVDSGKYGYKKDQKRAYILSGAAHNTISLSNKNNDVEALELTGSLLETTRIEGDNFIIRGQAEFSKLFTQHREIRYNPSHSIKITDTLTRGRLLRSDKTTQYVSSLHFAEDIKPKLTETGFSAKIGNHFIIGHLKNKECELLLARGQKDPLLGWKSVDYLKLSPISVVQAKCPQSTQEIAWDIAFN